MKLPKTNEDKKKRRVKFPGICRHAAILGVSRITLWKIATNSAGKRAELPSLWIRYNRLLQEERANTDTEVVIHQL